MLLSTLLSYCPDPTVLEKPNIVLHKILVVGSSDSTKSADTTDWNVAAQME